MTNHKSGTELRFQSHTSWAPMSLACGLSQTHDASSDLDVDLPPLRFALASLLPMRLAENSVNPAEMPTHKRRETIVHAPLKQTPQVRRGQ